MRVLAFAASNSSKSINKQLVTYASSLLTGADVEILDMNDFEMPLYSSDRESASGIPDLAHAFFDKICSADGIMISFAEHNGSYSAAYKNIFDWVSRIDMKVYQNKPMVMLSTSPGQGGAANVLAAAKASAPHFGCDVKADLSIGKFYENFDSEAQRLSNPEMQAALENAVGRLF